MITGREEEVHVFIYIRSKEKKKKKRKKKKNLVTDGNFYKLYNTEPL